MGNDILAPIHSLDACERECMPTVSRWTIVGSQETEHVHVHRTPASQRQKLFATSSGRPNYEPENILDDFPPVPETPRPNCKGVRWLYPDAIAKTLEELDYLLERAMLDLNLDPTDKCMIVKTIIKDSADGMGDIAVHKEAADRTLPDKVLRFSFAVLQCSDENREATSDVCIEPIKYERFYMQGKI